MGMLKLARSERIQFSTRIDKIAQTTSEHRGMAKKDGNEKQLKLECLSVLFSVYYYTVVVKLLF